MLSAKDFQTEDQGGFIQRSIWVGVGLATSGLLISALLARWDWFLGLLLGSGLSLFNFRWLVHSISKWFGQHSTARPSRHWRSFLFRLLFTAGVMILGIFYLPMNLFGLVIGLFVAQGGLLLSFFLQGMKLGEE